MNLSVGFLLALLSAPPGVVALQTGPALGVDAEVYERLIGAVTTEVEELGFELVRREPSSEPALVVRGYRVGRQTTLTFTLLGPDGKELATGKATTTDDTIAMPEKVRAVFTAWAAKRDQSKSATREGDAPDGSSAADHATKLVEDEATPSGRPAGVAPPENAPAGEPSGPGHEQTQRGDDVEGQPSGPEIQLEENATGDDADGSPLVPAAYALGLGGGALAAASATVAFVGAAVALFEMVVLLDPNGLNKDTARTTGLLGLAGLGVGLVGLLAGAALGGGGAAWLFALE